MFCASGGDGASAPANRAMPTITSAKTAPMTTTVLRATRRRLFVAILREQEPRRERRRVSRKGRRLPLDGARESGDVVLDEEGVDEGDWDRAQESAGHERAPVEDVAAHELGEDSDRNRLLLRRREEDESVEELVPGQSEREDSGRENSGDGEREADADHGLDPARPVDPRAILDLPRNGLEIAHQQPGAGRYQERPAREDHRARR